jgi:methyltransferase (TIGR00027 family)
MKEGKPSATAEANAAFRAAELMRPEDERVCHDPYAKDFVGTKFSIMGKSRLLTKIALWYAERVIPGGPNGVIARTRYIDDYLEACIDDGIAQLVILGAGYDSRAYRVDRLKGKTKVFEVDHPYTQRAKVEKVKKIFGFLPDDVVYVPIDLDKRKLSEGLFESGYDRNLKTLFIWEGTTQYLKAEAVDETLAFISNNSGEGSSIIFDYAFQSALDGTLHHEEAKKWRAAFERRGEPPTFGIEEEAIEEFLSSRGFFQVKNVTTESLEGSYFSGANQGRRVTRLGGIVHATVKPQEQT